MANRRGQEGSSRSSLQQRFHFPFDGFRRRLAISGQALHQCPFGRIEQDGRNAPELQCLHAASVLRAIHLEELDTVPVSVGQRVELRRQHDTGGSGRIPDVHDQGNLGCLQRFIENVHRQFLQIPTLPPNFSLSEHYKPPLNLDALTFIRQGHSSLPILSVWFRGRGREQSLCQGRGGFCEKNASFP